MYVVASPFETPPALRPVTQRLGRKAKVLLEEFGWIRVSCWAQKALKEGLLSFFRGGKKDGERTILSRALSEGLHLISKGGHRMAKSNTSHSS
jgi:hypothetical protein